MKKTTDWTTAKKSAATAKTNKIFPTKPTGTRVEIPADAFAGLPLLKFNNNAVYVSGVGRAVHFIRQDDWESKTRHRRNVMLVGKALLVGSKPQTIGQLLRANSLSLRSNATAARALAAKINEASSARRWATEKETAAYIEAERALRERYLKLAIRHIHTYAKNSASELDSAKKRLALASAKFIKTRTALMNVQALYPNMQPETK